MVKKLQTAIISNAEFVQTDAKCMRSWLCQMIRVAQKHFTQAHKTQNKQKTTLKKAVLILAQ